MTGLRRVSIRTRLTALVLVLAAVVVSVSALATYVLTREWLTDRLDRQLRELASGPPQGPLLEIARTGVVTTSPVPGPTPRVLRSDSYVAVALPTKIVVLGAGRGATAIRLTIPPAFVQSARTSGRTVIATAAGSRGDFRVAATPVAGTSAVVLVGVALTDVHSTLHRLVLILLAVGGTAIIAVGVVAFLVVRVALHPLNRVVATADAITAGDLSQRAGDDPAPAEVQRVSHAFDAMLGRLERSFVAQRDSEVRLRRFAGDASHELRTPLTSIRGTADLYRRGAYTKPGDIDEAMDRIHVESQRMSGVVDELLLLARLGETPQTVRASVALHDLVREVAADVGATSQDHRITVATAGSERFLGDETLLRRAIANLVLNAVVHTPPGTTVEVRSTCSQPFAEICVIDDGPGLPGGDPDALFDRFVRGDSSRSRSTGGSGLGLAIVRAVSEAHGGTAHAERRPGGGSRFVMTLAAERVIDAGRPPGRR